MGLKYYADLNDVPVSDLLRQASIKTDNHLIDFSNYSWQDFPETVRVKEHKLSFMKVGQFTMTRIFQDQLLNQVHKVSTMQYLLQKWIYHISG